VSQLKPHLLFNMLSLLAAVEAVTLPMVVVEAEAAAVVIAVRSLVKIAVEQLRQKLLLHLALQRTTQLLLAAAEQGVVLLALMVETLHLPLLHPLAEDEVEV
jgi:hypothetical protein